MGFAIFRFNCDCHFACHRLPSADSIPKEFVTNDNNLNDNDENLKICTVNLAARILCKFCIEPFIRCLALYT